MSQQALQGVKILDFSWVLAAPLATKLLGMHGATVIKVESSHHPDILRQLGPMVGNIKGINRSGAFSVYNNDKLSIALNLNKPKAMTVLRKLIAWCDIVVENFSPGHMEERGLGWEELKKVNPGVIMLRVSLNGQTGPGAQRPGFGGVFQSQVGFTELIGWPDREPVLIPTAFTDQVVPWYVTIAAIAALEYRDKTGRGLYIDIGQFESGLNFLMPAALDYTVNGRIWTRTGNRLSHACPHGVYRCQGDDRWVAIAVFNDNQWRAFTRTIGQPSWTTSVKFSTLLRRKQNEDEIDRLIETWTVNHTAEYVMRVMRKSGVPAGVVETNKDLYEDPQLSHRNHYIRLQHPEMGSCVYDAASFRLSKTPAELKLPAPCLGEHTAYVCSDILGIPDEEFLELMAEGVFE